MTHLTQGRKRATMATLLASALAALTLVPLSQAATEGSGGGPTANKRDRFASLDWHGLYLADPGAKVNELRGSSEYLDATAPKNPAGSEEDIYRVRIRSTIWDRSTGALGDGVCARVRIQVLDSTETAMYTTPDDDDRFIDCDGRQNEFDFTTYRLPRRPEFVKRTIWTRNGSTSRTVSFYVKG